MVGLSLRKRGERDRGLNILVFQAREIREHLFDGIAVSQAREHSTKGDTCSLEHGLPAADTLVSHNPPKADTLFKKALRMA